MIFIITILFGVINAGNIIPDPQNPVLIYHPTVLAQNTNLSSSAKIDVRFSIEESSPGLTFGQYIALVFPPNISDLQFDQTDGKYSCELTDGTTVYSMKAEKPLNSSEGNYAYCKLIDSVNVNIKSGSKFNYKLTITLLTAKLTSNYVRSLKLFTSTSNKLSKIVIDQVSFLGNIANYPDASTIGTKSIDITSSSIQSGSNVETNIYPYQTFDVLLNIKSNIFISANDYLFVFRFNKNVVSAPQSAISNAISLGSSTDALNAAIKGSLGVSVFSSGDGVVVTGMTEDLVPNRQFQLVLKSWIAQDKLTNKQSSLEMMVYYKNTYSLVSYVVANTSFFRISYATLTITATHPLGYDIFRSGVFPMKFSFSSNRDLINGGYVLIQQSNTQDLISRFNFVAATCDFSDNDNNFDQGFGKRPQCFPIRTDFNYTGTSSSGYSGSGIFFNVKSIQQNKIYYVTVWGSADSCGGSTENSFKSYDIPNQSSTFTQFAFQTTIYPSIIASNQNENRFLGVPIIAQSIATSMTHKCWNTMIQLMELTGSKYAPSIIPFHSDTTLYKVTHLSTGAAGSPVVISKDLNLYREFTNFELLHIADRKDNLYLGGIGVAANTPTESFIYGTSQITTSSYFTLKTIVPVMPGQYIHEVIPSPITWNSTTTSFHYLPGRLELKLPRNWFSTSSSDPANETTPGCYLSWGFSHQINTTSGVTNGSEVIHYDITTTANCPDNTKINNMNFIGSFINSGCTAGNNPKAMMDYGNSILPSTGSTNTSLHFKILSLYHNSGENKVATNLIYGSAATADAAGNNYFAFPVTSNSASKNINVPIAKDIYNTNFILFSSCLKWNPPSTIKSLYTAIDIQLSWLYSGSNSSSTSGNPIRSMRFIKLFPEGGVFQDVNGNNKKVLSNTDRDQQKPAERSYKLHFGTGGNNTSVGVCLIEIYGKGLTDTSDSSSSVLAIWIGFGVILETDYNDLNSNYPVAPLYNASYASYGLQSGYFMNGKENFYVHSNFSLDNDKFTADNLLTGNAHNYPLRNLLMQYTGSGSTTNMTFETTAFVSSTAARSLAQTISSSENGYVSSNISLSYHRSHYLFLMGSLVIINGITSNNVTTSTNSVVNNLLIPIYCPINEDSGTAIKHTNGLPTLYMAYLTMSAFNSISSVNRIYSHRYNTGNEIFMTVISPTVFYQSSTPYYRNAFTNANLAHTSNFSNYLFTLRWASYTSSTLNNESIIYLYHNTTYASNPSTINYSNCTGHSFLINSKIVNIDPTNLGKSNLSVGEVSLFNGTKKFYYLGFEFNKFIGIGLSNGTNSTPNDLAVGTTTIAQFSRSPLNQETSNYYLTGVKRPSVESFFINGAYFSSFNQIGYFCASAQAQSGEMYSNYLFQPSSLSRAFIVDFNPPVTSPKAFTVLITQDKSEPIFKSDIAGNTKIDITFPAKIPRGFSIKFFASSNAFNSNTICGVITTSNQPVDECRQESSTLMSCPVNRTDSKYVICCYNVSINNDTFSLSSLYAYSPAQPNQTSTNTKFNTDIIYDASSQISPSNTLTWATAQSSGTDVIGSQNAKITKIDYQQVIQESGIGVVYFTVSLPREPVRNSAITFSGDFTSMQIQNTIPRCLATFGNNIGGSWDGSGDVLLDTCDVSGLNASTSPIIITTKDLVYKCGLNFSNKSLTVKLWPVIVINWKNTSGSYKVTMTLNNASNDAIAFNTPSFTMPNTLSFATKPGFINQWDTLCSVSSVTPKIPGEYADYTFDFDLDTNKSSISSSSPNEVSIFFPFTHYGSGNDSILCFYNGSLLNCSFTDEGILNIRFTTVLPIGSGKKIQITVSGVYNPSFESDIYFPCTVNKTDFSTGVRNNVITGSGKLTGGIPILSTTNLGVIRFINNITVSDVNPRNASTHTFRITFDSASGLTSTPITIQNTPQIIITFPKDYNLAWYNGVKATAVIEEFVTDPSTNTIIKNTPINPANVSQSGNRITIVLNSSSVTFSNNWRYWEIKLSNIIGPTDSTGNTNNGTTGPYSIILTNSNYSSIYRTYTNLNNLVSTSLNTQIDPWITNNRGIEYKFDNSKWVLDINTSGVLNKLTIRPGRFFASSFQFKTNSASFLQPRDANISLNDQTFRLADNSYSITTASYQSSVFYIGVPCGTAPGSYLINFSMSGENINTFFAPLSPVQVAVDPSNSGTISFVNPPSIPAGASTLIYFSLSEPNVDNLNVTWSNVDTNKNDSTAQISNVTIPPAVIKAGTTNFNISQIYSIFKITNLQATSNQVFKANPLNTCFNWLNNIITITISGFQAIIPNQYDFTTSFKYYNSDTDSSLTVKNSIKFTFNPPYFPIYVYCALVCFNRNFPSDDLIKSSVNNNYNTDNLTRYYSSMFNSKTAADIIFDNLVRGQRYKLRCIISSTEGDISLRTSASINIDQLSSTNGTSSQFIPSNPIKTQCAQYYFTSDPGQETKLKMINYCQKLFSQTGGWSSNGCIICTDSGLTYTSPGLILPTNLTCSNTINKGKLRFLQSTTPNAPGIINSTAILSPTTAGSTVNPSFVNQSNPITFSICPVQHPVCPSDVTGNKLYVDYFNQLISDTKSSEAVNTNLGIKNVPVNNTLLVNDNNSPDISKNFVVNILSLNLNGLIQFSATFTSALRCSWQISETASAPSSGTTINSCADTQWCGKNFYVGTLTANTSTNVNNLKPFTSGKSYGLYFACFNDIPFSTSVSNVFSVNLSLPSSSNTNTNTSNGNVNNTSTNTTNISGGFRIFSLSLLFIIAFLF